MNKLIITKNITEDITNDQVLKTIKELVIWIFFEVLYGLAAVSDECVLLLYYCWLLMLHLQDCYVSFNFVNTMVYI